MLQINDAESPQVVGLPNKDSGQRIASLNEDVEEIVLNYEDEVAASLELKTPVKVKIFDLLFNKFLGEASSRIYRCSNQKKEVGTYSKTGKKLPRFINFLDRRTRSRQSHEGHCGV
jgi:hypothetical protein